MLGSLSSERGQAVVEFGIIGILFFTLTAGLVDAGRSIFQFNALSQAARYGARWGSVVGGTCLTSPSTAGDWCNQLGAASTTFWSQPGNKPLEPAGTSCPATYAGGPSYFYRVSAYRDAAIGGTGHPTTIVGAVAQRFDTNSTSTNLPGRSWFSGGIDLSQLYVCIQLDPGAWSVATSTWAPMRADTVSVTVSYTFKPVSSLFGSLQIPMSASSDFTIE